MQKKFHFEHLKPTFFYFTLLFLQNTHINLFIIHIYSNKIFISLTLSSPSQTQHNPHSHHLPHRHQNPHKPITPESQRKLVKKKRNKPSKKNQKTPKNNQKPAPQSLIPPTHNHNHYHGSLKLDQKWIKTHEILGFLLILLLLLLLLLLII